MSEAAGNVAVEEAVNATSSSDSSRLTLLANCLLELCENGPLGQERERLEIVSILNRLERWPQVDRKLLRTSGAGRTLAKAAKLLENPHLVAHVKRVINTWKAALSTKSSSPTLQQPEAVEQTPTNNVIVFFVNVNLVLFIRLLLTSLSHLACGAERRSHPITTASASCACTNTPEFMSQSSASEHP